MENVVGQFSAEIVVDFTCPSLAGNIKHFDGER